MKMTNMKWMWHYDLFMHAISQMAIIFYQIPTAVIKVIVYESCGELSLLLGLNEYVY